MDSLSHSTVFQVDPMENIGKDFFDHLNSPEYGPEDNADVFEASLEHILANPTSLFAQVEQYRSCGEMDIDNESFEDHWHDLSHWDENNHDGGDIDIPDGAAADPGEDDEEFFKYDYPPVQADIPGDVLWQEMSDLTSLTTAASQANFGTNSPEIVNHWPASWGALSADYNAPDQGFFDLSSNEVGSPTAGLPVQVSDPISDLKTPMKGHTPYLQPPNTRWDKSPEVKAGYTLCHPLAQSAFLTAYHNMAQPSPESATVTTKHASTDYHGYPSSAKVLPPYISLEDICRNYPNHVRGFGLRPFIRAGWGGRKIHEFLPEDARHNGAQRPWNYLQKALAAEEKRMAKEAGVERKPKRIRKDLIPVDTDQRHSESRATRAVRQKGDRSTSPITFDDWELEPVDFSREYDKGGSENPARSGPGTGSLLLLGQIGFSEEVSRASNTATASPEDSSHTADRPDLKAAIGAEIDKHKDLLIKIIQKDSNSKEMSLEHQAATAKQIWRNQYDHWQECIEQQEGVQLHLLQPSDNNITTPNTPREEEKMDPLGLLSLVLRKSQPAPHTVLNLEDRMEQQRLERDDCLRCFLAELQTWTTELEGVLVKTHSTPQPGGNCV